MPFTAINHGPLCLKGSRTAKHLRNLRFNTPLNFGARVSRACLLRGRDGSMRGSPCPRIRGETQSRSAAPPAGRSGLPSTSSWQFFRFRQLSFQRFRDIGLLHENPAIRNDNLLCFSSCLDSYNCNLQAKTEPIHCRKRCMFIRGSAN